MIEVAEAIARLRASVSTGAFFTQSTQADVLRVCDAAERWLRWIDFVDTATLEQPVSNEELTRLIAWKENWIANAKAWDAVWPEQLQGKWEVMEQELQALLELRELRKQAKADSED